MNPMRLEQPQHRHPMRRFHFLLSGLSLILLGVLLALANLGTVAPQSVWQILPILIGLSGLVRVVTARRFFPGAKGLLRIALAIWLYACIGHYWGLTFHNSWPVLLILFGCRVTLRGLFQRRPLAQEMTS
ncbi:hypothetical protein THUN1379_12010 [Paludibacterium sp. THUN1379]|nr:hypothetical protein THUN1379_12010 [Paludibacterium sp. THUN1379]